MCLYVFHSIVKSDDCIAVLQHDGYGVADIPRHHIHIGRAKIGVPVLLHRTLIPATARGYKIIVTVIKARDYIPARACDVHIVKARGAAGKLIRFGIDELFKGSPVIKAALRKQSLLQSESSCLVYGAFQFAADKLELVFARFLRLLRCPAEYKEYIRKGHSHKKHCCKNDHIILLVFHNAPRHCGLMISISNLTRVSESSFHLSQIR